MYRTGAGKIYESLTVAPGVDEDLSPIPDLVSVCVTGGEGVTLTLDEAYCLGNVLVALGRGESFEDACAFDCLSRPQPRPRGTGD